MKVGIPKEIKQGESRVGMTPAGVSEFVKRGHTVYVQHTAGDGSGFPDKEYEEAGASILPTMEECERELTDAMLKSGAVCIAYETVQKADRSLPLLIPMSEVAGRMATLNGAYYLQKTKGGKGKLISAVPGVEPARVLVLGGGTVGEAAARMAAGLGASVIIADINLPRLRQLGMELPPNVHTIYSTEHNIRKLLPTVDIVVGSVLIPGAKCPHLITRDMLKLMEPGSVLVDVAIDQGGCFETSRPTTHEDPVYTVDGIVHYCVANIPGAVSHTSTLALTNATLRYALALADKGWQQACRDDHALYLGLNVVDGKVTFKAFFLEDLDVLEALDILGSNGNKILAARWIPSGR